MRGCSVRTGYCVVASCVALVTPLCRCGEDGPGQPPALLPLAVADKVFFSAQQEAAREHVVTQGSLRTASGWATSLVWTARFGSAANQATPSGVRRRGPATPTAPGVACSRSAKVPLPSLQAGLFRGTIEAAQS